MQADGYAANSIAKECKQIPFNQIADKVDTDRDYADLWHLLGHMLHPNQAERATLHQVIQSGFLTS